MEIYGYPLFIDYPIILRLRPCRRPPLKAAACWLLACWLATCWSACWLAGWLAGFLIGLLRACCLLTLIGRSCGTGRGLEQNSCFFGCLFPGSCFLNFSAEMCYFFITITVLLETDMFTFGPQACHLASLVPPLWHPGGPWGRSRETWAYTKDTWGPGFDFYGFCVDFGTSF